MDKINVCLIGELFVEMIDRSWSYDNNDCSRVKLTSDITKAKHLDEFDKEGLVLTFGNKIQIKTLTMEVTD